MATLSLVLTCIAGLASAAVLDNRQASSSASVEQIFQTFPQIFAGPTKTGSAPFLAETNPAAFGSLSYVPNTPLATALPIQGIQSGQNIFLLMGQLTPYQPNPVGFGSNEYSLPPGTNISQVHLLSRHGSRYPTGDSSVSSFGSKLHNITSNGTASWSGELSFLNSWTYKMGAEILVPKGRQELYDSGVLFYYNYGHLYNTSTKILARTTTQDRMLKSAENFMAGFFGLEWTKNATLEVVIEQSGFNNTLAGYFQCNNSNNYYSTGGNNASRIWENIYLANATQRLKALSGGYNWTVADTYNAQTLCPYETVAFGYSAFCDLFTYEEWQGFEYSIDLQFYGNNGFGSPVGRGATSTTSPPAQPKQRDPRHLLRHLPPQPNPLHGLLPRHKHLRHHLRLRLRQFNQSLPATGPPANQQAIVSHMTPFGTRMYWEIITAPSPVKAQRPAGSNLTMSDYYESGNTTKYVHILLNQRTIPLYKSYPECEVRDDGWCELETYLNVLGTLLDQADYEQACFGTYPVAKYGEISDGRPLNATMKAKRDAKRVHHSLARELGAQSLWHREAVM
ncbi:3-phytase A [Cyphellophora attinorum]|uniref:3-phytase n=1 Tax=Cyphellophora attinorum TaxID=1664694 RepID=A0A0N1NXS3_9EURO|nr:3-phytase A [Phialophora attinorum]KPI34836.1 3-phytase A [Phialophora attinorum]